LRAIGGNIAVETVQSGPAIVALPGEPGVGIVRQAFIERSNVEIAEEYMELRLARRQYAMIQQMLLRR
jgi:flagellar basal-body rod protein FlgG